MKKAVFFLLLLAAVVNATYALDANFRTLETNKNFSAPILNVEDAEQAEGSQERYKIVSGELTGTPPGGESTALPSNFVFIEGGTFLMGSNNGTRYEKPPHQVTVKSFSMSKHEVTQKEWVEIMGSNPSHFKGDNRPVEMVSWNDAVEYCNKRSLKEGLTPAYQNSGGVIVCDFNANGYRLPTEAEWEYAAKGGNKDSITYAYSGSDNVETVAWYKDNSDDSTHDVGTKPPNSLGLYDMTGNVWEWCWDLYGRYSSESQTDPAGAPSGSRRILRGGSWISSSQYIRSASRTVLTPSARHSYLGFRLVRSLV